MADVPSQNRINVLPWWPVVVVILGGAIAWGTLTTSVQAVQERVEKIEKKRDDDAARSQVVGERLAEVGAELRALRSMIERQWGSRP